MFRATRIAMPTIRLSHLATGLLAGLLLLSIEGVVPQPADAGSIRGQMASVRRSQVRSQDTMRRADKRLKVLRRAKARSRKRATVAARQLRKMVRKRERVQVRLTAARDRLTAARMDRDRKLRVRPNPNGPQIVDRPRLRKRVRKLDARADAVGRKVKRLRRKARHTRAVKVRKAKAVVRTQRRIERKIRQRERAEGVLGGSIKRMVELAQRRASSKGGSRIASAGFKRPARGRTSQRYGCTRVRKGRCVAYHDGIDIATRRGARVRASAAGYVAYVGWNPWDRGRRAYIVIIGHAGGYETIYGHLLPIRKVRSGQRVRRGQTIGRVGSTGHSTGPHVHWEVSKGFVTRDPRSAGR
jgi:murein DD-endopeptidase MepM/ murein hydrolase activator NlpD